jgi:ANTAR domain
MRSKDGETADAAGSHNRKPQTAGESAASGGRDHALSRVHARSDALTSADSAPRTPSSAGIRGRSGADTVTPTAAAADASVARRTPQGWRIGDEEVSDLTSAMVLADLLAAELAADSAASVPGEQPAAAPSSGHATPRRAPDDTAADSRKLARTVAQLEHALTARVRVEQAIGVLAERHRLRPRQAFELLRSAARTRGKRVLEIASEVVDSATNPLLRIPEELAKPPVTRRGGRVHRRTMESG